MDTGKMMSAETAAAQQACPVGVQFLGFSGYFPPSSPDPLLWSSSPLKNPVPLLPSQLIIWRRQHRPQEAPQEAMAPPPLSTSAGAAPVFQHVKEATLAGGPSQSRVTSPCYMHTEGLRWIF